MRLGWIDFSKADRDKVLNVIHLLDESGAVDELGLGTVRDAFADYFFPGTSTVQTRAKYFLIVPYVLMEAETGKYGNNLNTILNRIKEEERECRNIMMKSTTSDGVIGRSLDEDSWVLRAPSNIYWNGIKQFKIFKEDLSVKKYIDLIINQKVRKKAKEYGNREIDAEENEKDDIDAGDITSFQFWNCDTYRPNWRDNLTIELLPEEAKFLKSQIIHNQNSSLLAFILKSHNISLNKYDSFKALTEGIKDSVKDPNMREMMDLANDFNNLVSIITTRYNWIVFDGQNDRVNEKWEHLKNDLKRLSTVNLDEIFNRFPIRNLNEFLQYIKSAIQNDDIDKVDHLIKEREEKIKGKKRAKTSRASEYKEEDWIGIDIFDYRYTPAKRIIQDIMNAGR